MQTTFSSIETIVHVIDSAGFYGAENVILNLMVFQQERRFNPVLLSLGNHNVGEKEIEHTAKRFAIKVIPLRFKNGLNVKGVSKLISTAAMVGAHCIHSHGYKANILLGILPSYLRKIPVIRTLHGWTSTRLFSKIRVYEFIDALSLRRVNRVVVVSKEMLNHPHLKMFGIRPVVINNGIPKLEFDKDQFRILRPDIALAYESKFKILGIGRLSNEKGFGLLIQAVAILKSRGIDVCLVLVGEGNRKAELVQLAQRERIADRTHFVGYIKEAFKMMPFFDVFVLPSYTEGLPITLLEAMQSTIPIVATTVGEVPEVLDHGACGYLVPSGEMIAIADACERIYRNDKEAKAKALLARKRALSEYSVAKMADRYEEEYRRMIEYNQ